MEAKILTKPADVLVVDDEKHICEMIRDGLSSYGIDCICASNPSQAKQLIETTNFKILISDIYMPDITGMDLLSHTLRHNPSCKVVLITGVVNTKNLADALQKGAYDFFQKPFELERFIEIIAKALADDSPFGNLPIKAARAMVKEAELKRASVESIQALVQTVEAKDPYTRRHSEQVTHYATCIAKYVGLPAKSVESIRIASLLHDIGKIGIPDNVLTKPGRLTKEEFEYIRKHPALGAEIMENISILSTEAFLVRHHHERWDGQGYPVGLAGEEIPFGSRIINLADSLDAMLMQRTYKTAYTVDKALDEFKRCGGSQFDPALAIEAIRWAHENPEKIIHPIST